MIDILKELFKEFPIWLKLTSFALLIGLMGYAACIPSITFCKSYWWIALIFLGINVILLITSGFVLSIKNRRTLKDNYSKKVSAYVFDLQDDQKRDEMFSELDRDVEHTYWVLGSSLNSLTSDEGERKIKKFLRKGIDIKLIMMDPRISSADLYCNSEDFCHIYRFVKDKITDPIIREDLLKELKSQLNHHEDSTKKLVVLNTYLNEYFETTDYEQRIKFSSKALESIRKDLDPNQTRIEARMTQALMSVSLTIVDAEFETGKMIVEFHLPFTQSRVMLKLIKKENQEVFDSLKKFYSTVLEKSEKIN